MPIGETAALLTALCWSFGSILFTFAGRKIGSAAVNQLRLGLALILLIPLHGILFREALPLHAGWDRWAWLGASGFVGYVIGDSMLFEAFVLVGPRIAMLLMTLVPVFSALLGFTFLGETLSPVELVAVTVTLAGIAWVVSDRRNVGGHFTLSARGVLMGLGGALGQAVGLLFARNGLGGGFSPVSANVIRVLIAAISLGILTSLRGRLGHYLAQLRDRKVLAQLSGAAVLGPVMGVILSLVAISHAKLGIASTLMSLSPVLMIPLSRVFFQEKISWRAVAGTIVAVAGSTMFFLT